MNAYQLSITLSAPLSCMEITQNQVDSKNKIVRTTVMGVLLTEGALNGKLLTPISVISL